MKYTLSTLVALLVVTIPASRVHGFGRGAAVGGARVGPAGGARAGYAARGVATGPYGGVHAGNVRAGSRTGPGGTTVQHVGGSGVSRGPLGGVTAGSGGATRVTGPGGRSYTTGHGGAARVGPAGGVQVRGGAGATYRGYGGVATAGRAGGVAVGPYGGVRTGAVGGVGVRGPLGAGVAVGHRTRYYSPTVLRTQAGYVRGGFRYNCFTPAWYRSHSVAWVAPRWVGRSVWVAPAWPAVAVFCGITAPPILYDYGSTVVIENNTVYVNGEQTASAGQYADQAVQISDHGRQAKPADNEEWQPLGVFGMIQGEEKEAQHIFQLAVNKAGVIRGNYYNAVADNTLPVYGSVDSRSQRACWSIGDKKTIVFEAGLNNLTQEQTPVLVHYGKERTEQFVLVRLEEPAPEKR